MQSLRKGEWSAITKVKVLSPEICLNVALGQEVLYSEASIAAHVNGKCVSGVPGSKSIAGHSTVHNGTWESLCLSSVRRTVENAVYIQKTSIYLFTYIICIL